MKYVLVTGGVVSGLGKGITASSIGVNLKGCGWRVTAIKIDPYVNIDAGTMSPFEHGEVFVLDDGGEADLDLGNYERFLDITLTRDNNITTGKIFKSVIERERRGEYSGKAVQVVPHVTNAIIEWIERVSRVPIDDLNEPADVCVIELGGTIGDIESMPFVEALRQLQFRVGPHNFCVMHVSLVPVIGVVGEAKTKPTQHGVKMLRSLGLSPDAIVCRCASPLSVETRHKLGLFCQVPPEHVISVHDVPDTYHVPLLLEGQGVLSVITNQLRMYLPKGMPRLHKWVQLTSKIESAARVCTIAMVGKYTGLQDSYLSVIKALQHASIASDLKLKIEWLEATDLEPAMMEKDHDMYNETWRRLTSADGVLVPGGFGDRGIEGMVLAANYARVNQKPYLGICLGYQIAVIEMARSLMGWKEANSTEIDPNTPHPIIVFMPEGSRTHMGGTMRLGIRTTNVVEGSLPYRLYGGAKVVHERHRHRYEVNPELVEQLEKGTPMQFVGKDETGQRMEIMQLREEEHTFFFGCQYHPEFKSRPFKPSPPFLGLMQASAGLPVVPLDVDDINSCYAISS